MIRRGVFPLLLVLAFAACNGGGAEEAQPTPTPTPTPSPAAAQPSPTAEPTPTATPDRPPSDGTIAYVGTDGFLRVRYAGGQQELIYAPENGQVYFPEWSPDGTRIAFTEVEFIEDVGVDFPLADIMSVVVVDLKGKEVLRVPRAMMPHWSPDGQALAVGAEPDVEDMTILMTPSIVDIETGQLRNAVPRLWTLDSPRWSPDGGLLVYATRDGLYVIGSTEGSAPRRIVVGEGFTKTYFTPSWSADGRIITFERDRSAGTPPGGVDSYVMVDVDQGIISRVGDSYPSKCGRALSFREQEAHWVPGTTSAAWSIQCTDETAKPGIWIKDMEEGAERFLDMSSVVSSVGLLDVTPDGKTVAFSNGSGGLGYTRSALPAQRGLVNIYVVGIEGGEPELLVEDAGFPIWQPQP